MVVPVCVVVCVSWSCGCRSHWNGCMNVAWALFWEEAGARNLVFFRVKWLQPAMKGVAEALVVQQGSSGEGLGGFGAEPVQVQQGSGEGSGEGSEEGSGEGRGGFGAEAGQVQQGSGEGSGEGLGGFGAEPGQVQQGLGSTRFPRTGEGLGGFGAEPGQLGSAGFRRRFRRRFQEALWQSQVRFNLVPAKVPEKVPEIAGFGAGSQVRLNKVPEKVPEKVLEKVWEALVQSQVRFNRVPEKVPVKVRKALVQSQVRFNRVPKSAWLRSKKMLPLLGIPPKLISFLRKQLTCLLGLLLPGGSLPQVKSFGRTCTMTLEALVWPPPEKITTEPSYTSDLLIVWGFCWFIGDDDLTHNRHI